MRFLTKSDCLTKKCTGADELPARSHSDSDEIREAPVEESANDVDIPKLNVLRNQTSKLSRVMYK